MPTRTRYPQRHVCCRVLPLLLATLGLTLGACGSEAEPSDAMRSSRGDSNCYVQLYDHANFRGENIFLRGGGEYPSLEQLPETKRNWHGQAASFKAGPRTITTFWSESDFKGHAMIWDGRTAAPTVDPPRSIKIACKKG